MLDLLLLASIELCGAAEAHSEHPILQSFSSGIRNETERGGERNKGAGGTSTSNSGITLSVINRNQDSPRAVDSSCTIAESPLGIAESQALRTMFVLLGIHVMGNSSGQFLASGAIGVGDFPIRVEYIRLAIKEM